MVDSEAPLPSCGLFVTDEFVYPPPDLLESGGFSRSRLLWLEYDILEEKNPLLVIRD